MTMNEIAGNQEFLGLFDDKLQTIPRTFTMSLPILEALGISNYDTVQSIDKLVFTMRDALASFKKKWQTLDEDKIKSIIRFCLTREL